MVLILDATCLGTVASYVYRYAAGIRKSEFAYTAFCLNIESTAWDQMTYEITSKRPGGQKVVNLHLRWK